MIKLFRKIRQNLFASNNIFTSGSFKKYFLYAIGEIILVVIGILIAVAINNWRNSIVLDNEEKSLYNDLIQELQTDLAEIQGNRIYNNKYLTRYNQASEIIQKDTLQQLKDTLAIIATELTKFSDFHNEESAYNKLAASGKLELVSNKEVLKQLQNLGMLYNYINRLEKNQEQFMYTIIPKIFEYIRVKPFMVMQPEKLYNYKFQNDIELLIKIGEEKDGLYERGEKDILDLIDLLKIETE